MYNTKFIKVNNSILLFIVILTKRMKAIYKVDNIEDSIEESTILVRYLLAGHHLYFSIIHVYAALYHIHYN